MRLPRACLCLFLAAYLCALILLGRSLTVDLWHGHLALINMLLASGDLPLHHNMALGRPPLGWLVAAPAVSRAFALGGPELALRAAHTVMPCFLAALLGLCYAFFERRFTPWTAFGLVVLMALNPLCVLFAPFVLFDIFSAIPLIAFLWASYRYLERPEPVKAAGLAALYVLAVLSRYHLAVLILVPVSYLLCAPGQGGPGARARALWRSSLCFFPAAGYLACLLFLAALCAWARGGAVGDELGGAYRSMSVDIVSNLAGRPGPPWQLYTASLWRQLGPLLFALMALGLASWLRRRREPSALYLLLSFLVPFAVMSGVIKNRDPRYLLCLLPLVYAAVGQGIEAIRTRLPARRWAFGALWGLILLLQPWRETRDAFAFLAREPALHTPVFREMAAILEAGGQDDYIGWVRGDIVHAGVYETTRGFFKPMLMGAPAFAFYVSKPVVQIEPDAREAAARAPARVVVPQDAGGGAPRWSGDALAKIYEVSQGRGTLEIPGTPWRGRPRWEVFEGAVRPSREGLPLSYHLPR